MYTLNLRSMVRSTFTQKATWETQYKPTVLIYSQGVPVPVAESDWSPSGNSYWERTDGHAWCCFGEGFDSSPLLHWSDKLLGANTSGAAAAGSWILHAWLTSLRRFATPQMLCHRMQPSASLGFDAHVSLSAAPL